MDTTQSEVGFKENQPIYIMQKRHHNFDAEPVICTLKDIIDEARELDDYTYDRHDTIDEFLKVYSEYDESHEEIIAKVKAMAFPIVEWRPAGSDDCEFAPVSEAPIEDVYALEMLNGRYNSFHTYDTPQEFIDSGEDALIRLLAEENVLQSEFYGPDDDYDEDAHTDGYEDGEFFDYLVFRNVSGWHYIAAPSANPKWLRGNEATYEELDRSDLGWILKPDADRSKPLTIHQVQREVYDALRDV